jgi:hypothetical protein
MTQQKKSATGRTLVACLNTTLFLFMGSIAWFVIFLAFRTWFTAPPPFMPVIIFALLGGAMSFVLEVDFALKIFAATWKAIGKIVSWFSA